MTDNIQCRQNNVSELRFARYHYDPPKGSSDEEMAAIGFPVSEVERLRKALEEIVDIGERSGRFGGQDLARIARRALEGKG